MDDLYDALPDLSHFVATELAPRHGGGRRASTRYTAPRDSDLTDQQKVDLRSALFSISSDDRGTWVNMGQALCHYGEWGKDLWLGWSAASSKFHAGDAERTWRSLRGDKTGYGAVFAEAIRNGWGNPEWVSENPADVFGVVEEDEPDTPAPRLRPVALEGFERSSKPPVFYVVEPYLAQKYTTLLGGHGGSGKSLLALVMAAHVAAGVPWAGKSVLQGRALYITLEDSGDMIRDRLRRIVAAYDLPPEAVATNLVVLDGSDSDATLAREVNRGGIRGLELTPVLAEVQAAAQDCVLVVVDNALDAFGGNENDRQQVRRFLWALTRVARKTGAALLLLAHVDKAAARYGSAGNSYSGSTAWHNGPRSRLALLADKEGSIKLAHEKNTLGGPTDPLTLAWSANGVLIPGTPEPEPAAIDVAGLVLDALVSAHRAGVEVPTATSGSKTATQALEPYFAPAVRKLPRWREQVRDALMEMLRSGEVARDQYKDPQRRTRERWVPAQP